MLIQPLIILLFVVWRVLLNTAVNGQGMYIHVAYQVSDLDSINFELMSMFAQKNERSYPPELLSLLYLFANAQQFIVHLVSLFYHRSIRSKMHKELSKVLLSQLRCL